jgi:hypothetical protein
MVALFGLSAASAGADDVYKCVGSDGRLSYQARPCAQGLAQSTVTIREAPPAPPPPPPARTPANRERVQSYLDRMKHSQPPAAPPKAPPVLKSYKCSADTGFVFYRHSACPSTFTLGESEGRDRFGDMRTFRSVTNVKSEEITRAEACTQIYKLTASSREGSQYDDRVSTYDKNLGRDSHCQGY